MSATTVVLQKLWFLAGLAAMDCWKVILTVKNLKKTTTLLKDVSPEIIALHANEEGGSSLERAARSTFVSNVFDIAVAVFISLDRIVRIVFRGNAQTWEAKEGIVSYIPPCVHYFIQEFCVHIFPILIVRCLSLYLQGGRHVRRKVVMLRESIEVLLVCGWIVILSGLAAHDNTVLNAWYFFAVGIIASIQGYVLWRVIFAFDQAVFYEDLDIQQINETSRLMWNFPPENLKLSGDAGWEVKYMGVLGSDCILMDRKVVSEMPVEQVYALVGLELGQWAHRHSIFNYAIPILKAAALGYFLMESYNNPIVNNLFKFSADPDPSVPMFIAYIWLWPYVLDCINYIESLLSCWTVLRGDQLALKRHKITDLTAALFHIAGTTEHYPIYDGLYSAWILARPHVLWRIQRLIPVARNQ